MPFVTGRFHLPAQQLADVGARHDDPLVDVERVAPDPGLVCQIRRGLARCDARLDHLAHGIALGCQQAGLEPGVELIDRQVQRVQNEVCGLVESIGGTMAVYEPRRIEAAYGIAQPVAYRDELVLECLAPGHCRSRITMTLLQYSNSHFLRPPITLRTGRALTAGPDSSLPARTVYHAGANANTATRAIQRAA